MEVLEKLALFYFVGGAVIGAFVASMDKVYFNIRGKPFPYPRPAIFTVCLVIWPVMLWQIISGSEEER